MSATHLVDLHQLRDLQARLRVPYRLRGAEEARSRGSLLGIFFEARVQRRECLAKIPCVHIMFETTGYHLSVCVLSLLLHLLFMYVFLPFFLLSVFVFFLSVGLSVFLSCCRSVFICFLLVSFCRSVVLSVGNCFV